MNTTASCKYLICADRSDVSKAAVRFASLMAKKRNASLAILHVVEAVTMQSLFAVADRIKEEKRQEAWDVLQERASIAQEITGTPPALLLREGAIGDEILSTVMEDSSISLLLLAASPEASGKGKLLKWLSGKLGDQLLVPIMLVPGNLTDQQIDSIS
jgi:nucleotide-binding universal stress UspA family protein